MNFQYRGRDRAGLLQQGTVAGADRSSALRTLQDGGLLVFSLTELRGLNLGREILPFLGQRPVGPGELATFCTQFAAMAGAGVPVTEVLGVLARQFRGRRLGQITQALIRSIEGGKSLSQAMRAHTAALPAPLVYITAVAEVTGRLVESYGLLARQFEQEDDFRRNVGSALAYPKVVMLVALLVILFMITFVLPTYAKMFSSLGAELPAPTRLLMGVGMGLKRYWYLILLVMGTCWAALGRVFRRTAVREPWQRLLLQLPVVGPLAYQRELSSLCRTMATMQQSGVPLLPILTTAAEATAFLPMRRALGQVWERVQRGDSFGAALRQQPIFDGGSVQIIGLGESTGNLAPMLQRVADLAEQDVEARVARLTTVLEPLMTLGLGMAVLGIIVPMLLPMFDILDKVK